MSQDDIWNPFGERVDNLSAKERNDMERAKIWEWHANGGGGNSAFYFDYESWLRNAERQH